MPQTGEALFGCSFGASAKQTKCQINHSKLNLSTPLTRQGRLPSTRRLLGVRQNLKKEEKRAQLISLYITAYLGIPLYSHMNDEI